MSLENYNFLKFSKEYLNKKEDIDLVQLQKCKQFIKDNPIIYPLVVEHSSYFNSIKSLEIHHYGGVTKLKSVIKL